MIVIDICHPLRILDGFLWPMLLSEFYTADVKKVFPLQTLNSKDIYHIAEKWLPYMISKLVKV